MTGLIRSEIRKIRTTNLWWALVLGGLGWGVVACALNGLSVWGFEDSGGGEDEIGNLAPSVAANMFTSGQYGGLLLTVLFGALIVTNEYHHQTATATFLTTPNRVKVLAAKLIVALGAGLGFGVVMTLIAVPVGMAVYTLVGADNNHLGDSQVQLALALNLLGYALWAVIGVGFGSLLRSQILTVVLSLVLYLVGDTVSVILVAILGELAGVEWIENVAILVPSVASQVMTTGTPTMLIGADGWPGRPIGFIVLAAWGILASMLGVVVHQFRDIS